MERKKIEEVDKYTDLGYVIKANGDQGAHVRERMANGARILGQVWSIGKRNLGDDWARRIWLFDKLVWSVMCYGVEIWGWKRREEMERIQKRYLRWVLGVSRRVGRYLVRKELQRDRLEAKAGMRALGYEKRLEEGRRGEIARRCRMEMRKSIRAGRDLGGREKGVFQRERMESSGGRKELGGRDNEGGRPSRKKGLGEKR